MPDHVHMLFQLSADKHGHVEQASSLHSEDLSKIMHSIKSYSANQINTIQNRSGILWQNESYDHIIRDESDFNNTLNYIYYNPIKKGLSVEQASSLHVAVEQASSLHSEYPLYFRNDSVGLAGWKPAPLGRIEYTVWSEVFTCPDCAGEVVFLDEALDEETKRVRDAFPCPHCGSELTKQRLDRKSEARFDSVLRHPVQTPKRKPALIVYSIHGKRHEKTPDEYDLSLLDRIAALEWPPEVPSVEIPPMV
jgi:hypothetical protein